jgi:hypothetical protein
MFLQICDGVLTYVGVNAFGSMAEGNPLILFLMYYVGIESALILIKTVSCLLIVLLTRLKSKQVFYILIFVNFIYFNVVLLWIYALVLRLCS